ncbi:hypothetical protein CA267_016510 [Alteromonas pelagimontana]|uniref:DUF4234 domain-containing protein n=1 Tax=Alteromonas pelagimontana TaxID=1858656 RepID=A0A6M4MGZ3_9ALTE|nr:hypothetical protein [Alteromonas pelagimontana]QJR82237.1 hypothetical protein CA267_016510 [Alteromonas pelagimontana]
MQTPSEAPVTAPPRRSFLAALLFFCTAGLYAPIWFALVIRDCRRITGQALSPFLWIFVPGFFFLQPFALPRFFHALRDAEKAVGVKGWRSFTDHIWMAGFFACSLYFWISYLFGTEDYIDILVFLANLIWLILLHHRINRLRRCCNNAPIMPRYAGYNPIEWAAVVVFAPILAAIFGYVLYQQISLAMIKEYEPLSTVELAEKGISIPLSQSGWRPLKVRKADKGEAVFKMMGPLKTMNYLVYIYSDGDSFNLLAENRYQAFIDNMDAPICSSHRELRGNSARLRSFIVCEGTMDGSHQLYVSTLLEGNKRFVEIAGSFSGSQRELKKYRDAFIADAQGLKIND